MLQSDLTQINGNTPDTDANHRWWDTRDVKMEMAWRNRVEQNSLLYILTVDSEIRLQQVQRNPQKYFLCWKGLTTKLKQILL
jgi:hypothetical protein